MKLTEDKKQKIEELKKQISVERDYIDNYESKMIYNGKTNNYGFTNIILISIMAIILIIFIIIKIK